MEKSWNFEIGAKSHGKIVEFDNLILHSYELAPLCGTLLKSKWRVRNLRGHGILQYIHGKVMEKSWNFVAKILRQP